MIVLQMPKERVEVIVEELTNLARDDTLSTEKSKEEMIEVLRSNFNLQII